MDGARTPPNRLDIAPMPQQAQVIDTVRPPIIPATTHGTFRCPFTPHFRPILTCRATRPCSPARYARAITGTRPGRDTSFGSSNDA